MSQDEYFKFKCEKGMLKRGLADSVEHQKRLKYEQGIILSMGYSGYFLICQDLLNWCRRENIYIGPGRGSAAGSLISYCLGITNLDPIEYGLIFERFLNPSRTDSPPDIDMDIEDRYRPRVIQYAIDKYGKENVAHIGTFGTFRAKSAIKFVSGLLGATPAKAQALADMTLDPIHGKPQKLKASVDRVADLGTYHRNQKSLEGQILEKALKVEGLVGNIGVHASGLLIASSPLTNKIPLVTNKEGLPTSQWDMGTVEEVGYIKFDFLGLDALSKIHSCIDIIRERHGVELDIDLIPRNDEKTYQLLRSGETSGLFQLETSAGVRDLLVKIKPTVLEDVTATIAIFRPGPLDSDYLPIYLGVRSGARDPEYLIPELEPLLSTTHGFLVYQEQAMNIARKLCGYSMADADVLRKAIGKKKKKLMDSQEAKFKSGWKKNGYPIDKGDILWIQLVAFADYSFNKSHAAAYALITYQTAYLKAHYPREFMCAVMQVKAGDKDQMIKYLAECKRLGIKVLPPDINKSQQTFSLDDEDNIRFGLGPIKHLGASSSVVIEKREEGSFSSFKDFYNRVGVGTINKKKLETLISTGAFDLFGVNRATLLAHVTDILDYIKLEKSYQSKMVTYQKRVVGYEEREAEILEGKRGKGGAKLAKKKLPPTPVGPSWPEMDTLDELSKEEIETRELELLGMFISSHPLDSVPKTFLTIDQIKEIDEITGRPRYPNGSKVDIAAVVTTKKVITTSTTKKQMAMLQMEDLTGGIGGVLFPNFYDQAKGFLEKVTPLKITGEVEITETKEGVTVFKLKVYKVYPLQRIQRKKIILNACVPVEHILELSNLLKKWEGDRHRVKVSFSLRNGTRMQIPAETYIGSYQTALEKYLKETNSCQKNQTPSL